MGDLVVTESLERLEAVIERGLTTFTEVGAALLAIRDARLYRQRGYERFEDYCQERWGFSRIRAHQLIEASEVVAGVLTTVNTTPPTSERQARELARLPDTETQAAIWSDVQAEHGEHVTASKVRDAVDEHLGVQRPSKTRSTTATRDQYSQDLTDEADTAAATAEDWACAKCGASWPASQAAPCPTCYVDAEPASETELMPAAVASAAPPPTPIAELARQQARGQDARAQHATAQRLAQQAGALDDPTVRTWDIRVAYTNAEAATRSKLLGLNTESVVGVLEHRELPLARMFIKDCRDWLSAFEADLSRGLRVVGGDEE